MVETLFRIYLDDSGNVDPGATNDPNQRYGSITGVILRADYLDATFNPSLAKLAIKHFGEKPEGGPYNLHRRVLNTPPDHGPFSVLKDVEKRKAWDQDALRMYNKAEYVVISACVDKVGWYYKFPEWNGDFYEVLVKAVLERAFYFLRNRGVAEVNIETKNQGRDQRLKDQYKLSLSGDGFDHIPADSLCAVFTSKELNIVHKTECRAGAQLADLLAGPALQHIRHLETGRLAPPSAFVREVGMILEKEKFYREGKGPKGYGRVWRPQG